MQPFLVLYSWFASSKDPTVKEAHTWVKDPKEAMERISVKVGKAGRLEQAWFIEVDKKDAPFEQLFGSINNPSAELVEMAASVRKRIKKPKMRGTKMVVVKPPPPPPSKIARESTPFSMFDHFLAISYRDNILSQETR